MYSQESCETQGKWKSKHETSSWALDNATTKWVTEHPAGKRVHHELAGQFLELPVIEFLHFKDLIVSKIVIINISEPIPVLSG